MISAQRPATAPHMHAIYTNLPANTRRAAGIPFLVGRAAPYNTQQPMSLPCSARPGAGSPFVRPQTSRRPTPPPRRNAISFHPSQAGNMSQNPFAVARLRPPRAAPPARTTPPLQNPAPARAATLVSAGHITEPLEPLRYSPPPMISYPPRDHSARLVASILLNRAERSRPMRGGAARKLANTGYVRSGLSVCVGADDA